MEYPDLPDHFAFNKQTVICPGTIPSDIYEDVGLTNSVCSECGAEFVWSSRNTSWVDSSIFEQMLVDANNAGVFANV